MVRVGSAELRELLVPKLIILPEQFNQKQLSVRQKEPFHLSIDWFGQPVLTNLKCRKKCWSEQKRFKSENVSICRTTLQREITTFSGLQLRRSFEISPPIRNLMPPKEKKIVKKHHPRILKVSRAGH